MLIGEFRSQRIEFGFIGQFLTILGLYSADTMETDATRSISVLSKVRAARILLWDPLEFCSICNKKKLFFFLSTKLLLLHPGEAG